MRQLLLASVHGEETLNNKQVFTKSCRIAISAIGLVVGGHTAQADWYVSGAQFSCSTTSGSFELLPFDKSSEEPNPSVGSGFTALPDGISNLKCRLGKRNLQAQIGVTPPQARGMCMGGGAVGVSSIVVDGVELLTTRLPFNWSCAGNEDVLVKVIVRTKGSMVELEQCTHRVSWSDKADTSPKCSIKLFDVDAIAAANAKTDHQLAEPETQARELATHLPADNDLSHVFPTIVPKGSKIPLCAHWSSVFLNAMVSPEKQRYGRIAGKKGERVYIHRTNPQLCQNPKDDGCTARAYVLPGDRVDVGFICGEWTHVQYRSRIRTQPPTKGWVETARVYGITPAIARAGSSESARPPQRLMTAADPLFQAVTAKDAEQVKRLITGGANPNGVDNSGAPLADAIQTGDADFVRTLISLGANVSAQPPNNFIKCRTLSLGLEYQEIFDALVKAGIDLNCRGGQLGSTQLMDIAGYNRLWAWERIHTSPAHATERLRDPLLLAKRLLTAGADPNVRDNWGRTALFYTTEANNIDVAELLLSSGADPNIAIESQETSVAQQLGSTPLMAAFHWYSLTNDPGMFHLLLTHGADPNYRNTSRYDREWDETTRGAVTFAGQTALTRASADGHYTLARLLLENGADPTIPREDGALPEAVATQNKRPEIAALISNYAKKRQSKDTPRKSNVP